MPLGPNATIQDCTILEIDPSGQVVWTWAASDHFDPAVSSTYAQTGFGPSAILADGGTSYDVFHCEAIDIDPANGNLLVSSRNMDSVFYVERASGRVVWKMGGAPETKDDSVYVTVPDPFLLQHGSQALCKRGAAQLAPMRELMAVRASDRVGVAVADVHDLHCNEFDLLARSHGIFAHLIPGNLAWTFA